jgi:hypothetical protein
MMMKLKYNLGIIAIVSYSTVHAMMGHQGMSPGASLAGASGALMGMSPMAYGMETLQEAGTGPFAALQEVVNKLEDNPGTNWKKVNVEDLRLHLVEMHDMTINVEVSQQDVKGGFKATITPTTPRSTKSLTNVLSRHPGAMKAETGWDMQVKNDDGIFTMTVTTDKEYDVAEVRGLGYIGIMAYGDHHQAHHWAIASGENPHALHNMTNNH